MVGQWCVDRRDNTPLTFWREPPSPLGEDHLTCLDAGILFGSKKSVRELF